MRARIISATGAVAAAALCALTVGGVAGAAAYPGNGLPPGTVTPPAITPAFTFTPTIQNAIFGVFGTQPKTVAIVTVEPVDLTLNPIVVPGTGNGTATIPVGATNHILIELGATFANAHVNGSLSLPGGLTVQYQGDTDSQGRIQFTIVVTDPHVSINGSIPIPVNYGQNTVLAAEEVGGKSIVQVLTVTIPNSSGTTTVPSGAPATGVASGSSSANVALVVGGAALVVVAAGLAITAARRRSSAQ